MITINQMINNLLDQARDVSRTTPFDAFLEYSGHVDGVRGRMLLGEKYMAEFYVYLDHHTEEGALLIMTNYYKQVRDIVDEHRESLD